jgi:hypothetical protein
MRRRSAQVDIKTSIHIHQDAMRTTLTIDDDLAAMLTRLRQERHTALKPLVNEALRRGLSEMVRKPPAKPPFQTRAVDLGRLKIDSIDNIAEALSIGEGEDFR